ncbi:zinc finger BED domain-containing protein RICESLEEPER 2 [Tanacetum coccineum]
MATQSSSTTTDVGSSSAPTVVKITPTSRNPQIWKDYNLCQMSDNMTKAQCKHCFHFFSQNSNSTLEHHISHPHCKALKTVPEAGQSSMSRDGSLFIGASSLRASGGNQMSRLLYRLKEHTNKKARNDPSLSSEYERYVHSDFVTHLENNEFAAFDLMGFRKAKESIFPVLSRMAMDIISVQATSVASESAFSTSGRVLSIQRTRLTLASLEMCMCLKDHLGAQECKQDKFGLENPVDFKEEILDAEVQQNKVIPLSEEEIALDVASSEGTMSVSGSGGEEVYYDMTNYGDEY